MEQESNTGISTAVHNASEARRRKLLARGQDRLAKITNSIAVEPTANLHANATAVRPPAPRSPSPPIMAQPADSSTSLNGGSPSPPSTTTDTTARQSYGTGTWWGMDVAYHHTRAHLPHTIPPTAAIERTWEQHGTPSSHPPYPSATSPTHVLERQQQQLPLTPSRRVHAALELLRPAQLLLAAVLALLVVTQSVLQGLAGQLAQRRLGDMGMIVVCTESCMGKHGVSKAHTLSLLHRY